MEYSAPRIVDLLSGIAWLPGNVLRIFWVRYSEGSRAAFGQELSRTIGGDGIIALAVRDNGFQNANAILSDVQRLFTENQDAFDICRHQAVQRVSVILLGKSEFQLPQGSSPIVLPHWFPVMPGRETSFQIADLAMSAEVALFDCPELRIEQIAELTYQLEQSIVERLGALSITEPTQFRKFVNTVHGGTEVSNCISCLTDYRHELELTIDARAYRPNAAKDAKSLISRLLKLVLNSSPKQLAAISQSLAESFSNSDHLRLKPTLLAAMCRPASKMDTKTANWHAIMLAFYQAYQLMNGAAHAGEYPHYSVSLLFTNSVDLRISLLQARTYVEALC